MIGDFHFIRPWALLAVLPFAALVWWIYRRQDASENWRQIVAPHLLPFLLSGQERRHWFSPTLLLAVGWLVTMIAIAGPTWQREPAPFADDQAAVAIVIKVSPSMITEDVTPTRLERGVQKVHDLLELRKGAKAALIAYAGTAHVVMPATSDGGIINTFAAALDPKIMPGDGDAAAEALRLADQALATAGGGSIVWVTDGVSSEQGPALAAWRKSSSTPVHLLAPILPGEELDRLTQAAAPADAKLTRLAADDSDVQALAHLAKYAPATGGEMSDRWQESGYWLASLIAALLLPFFRKGWMLSTAARG